MAEAASGATSRSLRRPNLFHGWYIIAAGATLQFLQSALLGQAYGAYVVLLREDFGWSKTMLSAGSSLREAESGIGGPLQGWLVDRLGPRTMVRVGVCVMGAGFMLFSRVQSPLTFFGAFFVMSVGASMAGHLTITTAAVHWFETRRVRALSLTSAGFAIGGMAVPITVVMLETFGWRATAFISGLVVIAVGLPLAQVFHRNPAAIGLLPDGVQHNERSHREAAARAMHEARNDFTLSEAVHTRAFWLICLGHASALFVVSSMSVHLVSHLKQSQGYSLGTASTIVFLLTLLFLTGTLTGGFVGDYVSKRKLLVACMAMHATGLLILSHAVNLEMVIAFTLLHGLAWGWRGPQMAAIRADYFGRSSFGKIMGVANMINIIGTICGPLIAGFLYDRTGNYTLGFDILACIAAAGSIFFILASKPPLPVRALAAI